MAENYFQQSCVLACAMMFAPAVAAQDVSLGGRYLVRGATVEVLEGSHDGRRLVIFEFSSMEDTLSFWNSPEYVELKKLREGVAKLDVWAVPGV